MIHSITGTLIAKRPHYFAVDVGGIRFKLITSAGVIASLPEAGSMVAAFTYLHVRENALELYGFLTEQELSLFESLNSVSGVGPKSALGIMGVARADQLSAAINEGKSELLTRASGIGKKIAERITLELKGKLSLVAAPATLTRMESDIELEETLMGLGYTRQQAKALIGKIDPSTTGFKERLTEALKKARR